MCRFTFYMGPSIRLSALLVDPSHSLIRQSTHSREREEPLNGDGFGVGWYAHDLDAEPAVFRSITPAWNNRNLRSLSRVVTSDCIFAHVRAATQSSEVTEANCHPFRWKNYMCMHNGDIGNFRALRRQMLAGVDDQAFGNVYGSTDSEHFFALIIDTLLRTAGNGDPASLLADALDSAITRTMQISHAIGAEEPSYLNVAVTDGHNTAISRFANQGDPVSLYYFVGALYPRDVDPCGRPAPDDALAVTVSSERLTGDAGWKPVPANHIAVLRRNALPEFRPCTATVKQMTEELMPA